MSIDENEDLKLAVSEPSWMPCSISIRIKNIGNGIHLPKCKGEVDNPEIAAVILSLIAAAIGLRYVKFGPILTECTNDNCEKRQFRVEQLSFDEAAELALFWR